MRRRKGPRFAPGASSSDYLRLLLAALAAALLATLAGLLLLLARFLVLAALLAATLVTLLLLAALLVVLIFVGHCNLLCVQGQWTGGHLVPNRAGLQPEKINIVGLDMSVTLTIENGGGVEGANSYLAADDFEIYADSRGYSYGADEDAIATALIRATAWLDATYRSRWPGVRTFGAMQTLLWPRKAGSIVNGSYVPDRWMTTVTDAEGVSIATTEIPVMLKTALAEAAYRELNSPGSLAPDLERGGAIESLQAGSVEIVYASTAPVGTTFTQIDAILSGLIGAVGGSCYTATAIR